MQNGNAKGHSRQQHHSETGSLVRDSHPMWAQGIHHQSSPVPPGIGPYQPVPVSLPPATAIPANTWSMGQAGSSGGKGADMDGLDYHQNSTSTVSSADTRSTVFGRAQSGAGGVDNFYPYPTGLRPSSPSWKKASDDLSVQVNSQDSAMVRQLQSLGGGTSLANPLLRRPTTHLSTSSLDTSQFSHSPFLSSDIGLSQSLSSFRRRSNDSTLPYPSPSVSPSVSQPSTSSGQVSAPSYSSDFYPTSTYSSINQIQLYRSQSRKIPRPPPSIDRPFVCTVCETAFHRSHDLKRHTRIHLAVKPFPCPGCDKRFARSDALKRHLLVKGHSGHPSDLSSDSGEVCPSTSRSPSPPPQSNFFSAGSTPRPPLLEATSQRPDWRRSHEIGAQILPYQQQFQSVLPFRSDDIYAPHPSYLPSQSQHLSSLPFSWGSFATTRSYLPNTSQTTTDLRFPYLQNPTLP